MIKHKDAVYRQKSNRSTAIINKGLRDLYLNELDADWEEETLEFRKLISYYECTIMEIEPKLKVLDKEFSPEYDKNPIESIQSRIKSNIGIMRKLKRKGLPLTLESASHR